MQRFSPFLFRRWRRIHGAALRRAVADRGRVEDGTQLLVDLCQQDCIDTKVDPALVLRVSPRLYESGIAKLADVVADQILGKCQPIRELAITDLSLHEKEKDAAPRGIVNESQELRDDLGDVARRYREHM
jgi:hypothetical protein